MKQKKRQRDEDLRCPPRRDVIAVKTPLDDDVTCRPRRFEACHQQPNDWSTNELSKLVNLAATGSVSIKDGEPEVDDGDDDDDLFDVSRSLTQRRPVEYPLTVTSQYRKVVRL